MIKKTVAGALLLSGALLSGRADAAPPGPIAPAAPPLAIVASVHAQRVDATLAALRGYLPFPINPQDALKDLVGDFNKLVSLSAPMDIVIALDPAAGENLERPLWGFAVGVTAAEDARLLAQSRGYLTDGKAGTYRLSVPVQSNGRGLFCYLTTLAGGAGRLACSGRDRDRAPLRLLALFAAGDARQHRERHRAQAQVPAVARVRAGLARERGALVRVPLLPARVREPVGAPAQRFPQRAQPCHPQHYQQAVGAQQVQLGGDAEEVAAQGARVEGWIAFGRSRDAGAPAGTGLANVRERLALAGRSLYENSYTWDAAWRQLDREFQRR